MPEVRDIGEEGIRAFGGLRHDAGDNKVCVREAWDAGVSGVGGTDRDTQFAES